MIRAIALLIAQGHSYHDIIWEYPIDLFYDLYEQCLLMEIQRNKQLAITYRLARFADNKDFKEYVSDNRVSLKPKKKKLTKEEHKQNAMNLKRMFVRLLTKKK